MRLLILSDLHVEFGPFTPPVGLDYDAVVLAGDIHVKGRAAAWAAKTFPGKPVILVLGNHDYYGSNLVKAVATAQADCTGSQVHLLHNSSVTIDGVRFLGGTLWTDYRLTGNKPLAMWDAQQTMNDHKKIRTGTYSKAMPRHMEVEHSKTRMFLSEALEMPFDGPTVVVTHHAPSGISIPARYKEPVTSHLNAAYASSLEHLMGPQVALWVHGHIHDSMDADIAGTRILCNPRGYLAVKQNPAFNPALIVEI